MRLSSYTIWVILTVLATAILAGCGPEGPDIGAMLVEYDENQLHCIYDERNDDPASALCLRSGAYKMDAPTWSSLDRSYELVEDTTVLSSGWMADADEYLHLGFFGRRTGDATLEVVFDYLEDDYRTETEPMTPAPYDDLERPSSARERISVGLGDWADFDYQPTPPDWADAVALHLIKKGKGTVSLARLVLEYGRELNGDREGFENMNGECETDDGCGSELVCAEVPNSAAGDAVCTLCDRDETCDDETVCGVSIFGDTRECVFPGIKSLGDFCAGTEECMEGVCCEGRCSICCDDEPCAGDGGCEALSGDGPFQCDPGQGAYDLGDVCYRHSDCASALCEGVSDRSDDTATCEDADAGVGCPAERIRYGICTEPSEAD